MPNRYNSIHAGPAGRADYKLLELLASETIKPGMAIIASAGQFVGAGASEQSEIYVCQDNNISGADVDENIEVGDTVFGIILQPGDLLNVLIADGETVNKGDAITTTANGRFQAATTGQVVHLVADEAYTNSTGAAALVRARVPAGKPTMA